MEINKLKDCVENFVQQNDMFVIGVKCNESNVIDIIIDSIDGVTLEKCIELNKTIEAQFDREVEDYELTVSSASISEPFSHIKQYQKNEGCEIEVQFMDNEKQIGIMEDVTEDGFTLIYSKKIVEEGKKRKILKEFCDKVLFSDARKVTLVIKF